MMTLALARNQLHDAISALCDPTCQQGHTLPSRYAQLCDAKIHARISRHTRTPAGTRCPAQIDCLKLCIKIDDRTKHLTRGAHIASTTGRLQWLTNRKFRPQDVELLEAMTAEIGSWAKEIDDLFAQKPLDLPNPCPQCGHDWAHRKNDDGDTVRARALAVTAEDGAICRQCHARWPVDKLTWLGHVLETCTQEIHA